MHLRGPRDCHIHSLRQLDGHSTTGIKYKRYIHCDNWMDLLQLVLCTSSTYMTHELSTGSYHRTRNGGQASTNLKTCTAQRTWAGSMVSDW